MDAHLKKNRNAVRALFWTAIATSAALTLAIYLLGFRLAEVPHLPDQGPAWYFWKLPQATFWSRFTSWGFYALHQISVWIIAFFAFKEKAHANKVTRVNSIALLVNLFFVLLHLIQTHVWYDGIAQDVPIWSSQYSVIVMLVIILYMLIPRRGIFLGKKVPLKDRALGLVKKYHGFYISWALVYTFWFHPMENGFGILAGFFYMFLLLTQLSFVNTRIHVHMGWIIILEVMVGFHGPAIAIMNGASFWPMFAFGFLFMFVFTQQYGFKLKLPLRLLVFVLFVAGLVAAYYFRGYGKLYEVLFIPSALYGGTFALGLVMWLLSLIRKGWGRPA